MERVKIRTANKQDIGTLTVLWQEMMRFHARLDERIQPHPDGMGAWQEYMRHLLQREDAQVLLAENEGEVVGYIVGYMQTNPPVFLPSRYGYISDICVASHARRHGIGRALFERLVTWFQEQGADHIELRVAARNPVSQAFWRELGCQEYMEILWYPLRE